MSGHGFSGGPFPAKGYQSVLNSSNNEQELVRLVAYLAAYVVGALAAAASRP